MITMEQPELGPPPLPPKTRRSPPDSATTVPSSADIFGYSTPEVRAGHSQICSTGTRTGNHVVKIRINPDDGVNSADAGVVCDISPCIRISVNSDSEMIQNAMPENANERTGYFFYNGFNCGAVMSSGQVSPSDTLDSGTCSDLDSTPPPLPKKKSAGVTVTVIGAQHKRAASLTSSGADADSDDNESNISCDSLNSGDLPEDLSEEKSPILQETYNVNKECVASAFLPQGLLQDIRDRSAKLSQPEMTVSEEPVINTSSTQIVSSNPEPFHLNNNNNKASLIKECVYEERNQKPIVPNLTYDTDRFYKFHLNEHAEDKDAVPVLDNKQQDDESFAGFRDILGADGSSTIRSAKGTVRGVKNRVRAGIATFLQINDPSKVSSV